MAAGIQGFEPQLKASKASVLPLDDIPIIGFNGLCPTWTSEKQNGSLLTFRFRAKTEEEIFDFLPLDDIPK